jgi:hypothetical protein
MSVPAAKAADSRELRRPHLAGIGTGQAVMQEAAHLLCGQIDVVADVEQLVVQILGEAGVRIELVWKQAVGMRTYDEGNGWVFVPEPAQPGKLSVEG